MIEINLLPWREQAQASARRRQLVEGIAAAALALILLLVAHVVLQLQIRHLQERLTQTQRGLEQATHNLEALRRVYQELDYQKPPEFDLSAILNHQRRILNVLRAVSQRVPPQLYVRQIRFDQQGWVIQGVAADSTNVLLFAERLKKNAQQDLTIHPKNNLFHFQLRQEMNG